MATPTNELRLELQVTGTNSNTWGEIANVNFRLIEDAISGLKQIATTGGTTTLTTANASAVYADSEDQARYAILKITGTLVSNSIIVVPAVSKIYHVWNATTGAFTVTVKVAGTGVEVDQGTRTILVCDGSEVYAAFSTSGILGAVANQDYVSPVVDIKDITDASYTFILTDSYNKYCRFDNASAISVTVPPNLSVAFPIGSQLHVRQVGAGQVTIIEGSGVTVNTEETLKLFGPSATITLIKVATDEWDMMGSLELL